jgi:ribosomal protein L37AE/L43A|tara:strand:+ start:1982 stop:2512 length:531 start_codon:yes stop_codon:yes gene_type:complete
MANRESERQDKAMKAVLRGETPEKRVMVGYEPEKKSSSNGKTVESHLTEIMKDVRMPWFCPECDKTMKIKLDNKFWRLFGHCFDCQVKIETQLRIEGKYEEWAENKIKENQKSYYRDMLQSLAEWKENASKVEFLEEVGALELEMESESWKTPQENIDKIADEAEEFIRKQLKELE